MSLDRGYPQPVGYLDGWTPPSPSPWRHTSLIDYWTSNFSTDAKTDPDAPHYPEIKRRVPTFECGICLDEQPEEDVACVEPCGHQFCRDCIRSYIRAKVGARQFPIACPTCAVEAGRGRTDPGDIATAFAEQIGLEEDEYQILHELEMSAFSVPVECRRCHASVFVDRDEYQAATTITCPLPRCDFSWCKTCHQEVREDDPHSCDGSAELRRLMEERGWTECPGCHTPVSKTEGCDHMICTTPGCNTHFCYSCGGAMDRNNIHNHVCVEA